MMFGGAEMDAALASTEEALMNFSQALELEFVEFGTILRKLSGDVQELESLSGIVAAGTSGSNEEAPIQFAFQLLKKAEDLVRATREQYEYVLAVFKQLQSDLTAVARERSTLNWILSPFKLTRIQFRLQACGFDRDTQCQFSTISEAIGNIISELENAVEHRFIELEQNARSAEKLAVQLSTLSLRQNQRTSAMLHHARSKLAGLDAALESSRVLALSMRERSAIIRQAVTNAIMALQCQDIVRQKFEHICAAMQEMRDHLHNTSERPEYAYLAEVAALQSAQSELAFDQLSAAGNRICEALSDVQRNAKRLAEQSLQTGAAALDGDVINLTITSIHEVLTLMSDAVTHVGGVLQLLEQLNAEFNKCTSEVMPLIRRLRLMSMNAQISATRVDAAKVLEVVARNTRTVSEQATEQLLAISNRVANVINTVTNLSERLSDYCDVASAERTVLTGDAQTAREKLNSLEADLRGALTGIGVTNERLAQTARTAGNVRFPTALADVRMRTTSVLQQIAATRVEDAGSNMKVAALQRNYTMAEEHAVHARATQGVSGQATQNTRPAPVESNVELF